MQQATNQQIKMIVLLLVRSLGGELRVTSLWRKLRRDPVLRARVLRRFREIEQILKEASDG